MKLMNLAKGITATILAIVTAKLYPIGITLLKGLRLITDTILLPFRLTWRLITLPWTILAGIIHVMYDGVYTKKPNSLIQQAHTKTINTINHAKQHWFLGIGLILITTLLMTGIPYHDGLIKGYNYGLIKGNQTGYEQGLIETQNNQSILIENTLNQTNNTLNQTNNTQTTTTPEQVNLFSRMVYLFMVGIMFGLVCLGLGVGLE